jgi:hypothetical protein
LSPPNCNRKCIGFCLKEREKFFPCFSGFYFFQYAGFYESRYRMACCYTFRDKEPFRGDLWEQQLLGSLQSRQQNCCINKLSTFPFHVTVLNSIRNVSTVLSNYLQTKRDVSYHSILLHEIWYQLIKRIFT